MGIRRYWRKKGNEEWKKDENMIGKKEIKMRSNYRMNRWEGDDGKWDRRIYRKIRGREKRSEWNLKKKVGNERLLGDEGYLRGRKGRNINER